jgi:hypothetical protein
MLTPIFGYPFPSHREHEKIGITSQLASQTQPSLAKLFVIHQLLQHKINLFNGMQQNSW